jgi:hypothetical protein
MIQNRGSSQQKAAGFSEKIMRQIMIGAPFRLARMEQAPGNMAIDSLF